MRLPSCLVDTNVLLRATRRQDPVYAEASEAIDLLMFSGTPLLYTYQNIAEMWNVMTRPASANGLGLSIQKALAEVVEVEGAMTLLDEDVSAYREWRRLIDRYEVRGLQVHDTRLVAAMLTRNIRYILTMDISDFARFSEIQALHPRAVLQDAG